MQTVNITSTLNDILIKYFKLVDLFGVADKTQNAQLNLNLRCMINVVTLVSVHFKDYLGIYFGQINNYYLFI